ncbi:MAG: KpsF/GutQ family sugar-phosphate isomerase [Nitrospirae bacterium]|nr:MAG: KpsF/GutQ family sugar-phosphate isomerase [Nitrospirota bacterium]
MNVFEELKRVIELECKTIAALYQRLSPAAEKAVYMLHTCTGKVIVTGVGKSGLIAQKIAATLVSTGTPAVFLHAGEGMHGDIGIVAQGDVVIAVGKSGESEELLTILPFVRKMGAHIIAITARPESTMAQLSDLVLMTPVEEEACPLNMAPTCSTTAALVLGDALAVALMRLKNFQPADFALNHPGGQLGKRLLFTVGDVMRRGAANPMIHVSATPKAMLMEMTNKRAGAVSVVDDEQRLVGLVTDYDVRQVLEAEKNLFDMTVREIMNPHPERVRLHENAYRVLEMMEKREKPISVLPVIDDQERVVGMIHLHDLIARGL